MSVRAPWSSWSGRTVTAIIGLGFVLSFIAGFLTYRARLHAYVKPLIAYARGDTGGCGLSRSYAALSTAEFDAAQSRLRNTSIVVDETPDGLSRVRTEQGTFWVSPGNDYSYVLAEQAIRIYGDGEHRVQPGDTVLDCGANIGAFTREALNAGAALVIAIEPVPYHVESLRRTFKTEIEAGRVRVVAKGVWNKEDTLEMNLFENALLDSFVMAERPEEKSERRLALPLTTVDQIVEEFDLPRVDFIKMDVEGAERQALEGSRQTIARFKPRMSIATENLPDDYRVLPEVITKIEPAYRWTTGPCTFEGPFTVRPETLYFRAR
jgi:FkbM family methyltransferase